MAKIPEITESNEEQEAGIRAHGEWIMGHPELTCRILAYSVRKLGNPLSRSQVTKTAIGEVAEMCIQLGICFDALGEAIFQENNNESLDLDTELREYAKRRPNPLRN